MCASASPCKSISAASPKASRWIKADRLSTSRAIERATVNAGGDLRVHGMKQSAVLIRDPLQPRARHYSTVMLRPALATSAAYFSRKRIGAACVNPIVHPRTANPSAAKPVYQVFAPTGTEADAPTKAALARSSSIWNSLLKARDSLALFLNGRSRPIFHPHETPDAALSSLGKRRFFRLIPPSLTTGLLCVHPRSLGRNRGRVWSRETSVADLYTEGPRRGRLRRARQYWHDHCRYIPAGWRAHRSRKSGILILCCVATIIGSAWGLYHAGSDQLRASWVRLHLSAGCLLPVAILIHFCPEAGITADPPQNIDVKHVGDGAATGYGADGI